MVALFYPEKVTFPLLFSEDRQVIKSLSGPLLNPFPVTLPSDKLVLLVRLALFSRVGQLRNL